MLFLYLIKIIFMKADSLFSLFTFLGGALVGAAVAILFAPESGDETRRKIKDSFDKEYQNLKEKINRLKTPEDMPEQASENE